jgi:hypothetical protein
MPKILTVAWWIALVVSTACVGGGRVCCVDCFEHGEDRRAERCPLPLLRPAPPAIEFVVNDAEDRQASPSRSAP